MFMCNDNDDDYSASTPPLFPGFQTQIFTVQWTSPQVFSSYKTLIAQN